MNKRIVVGLDPSNHSVSAQHAACELAATCGGTVIGVAVVDTKGIERAEAGGAVGTAHHAQQAEQFHLAHARKTCVALLAKFSDIAHDHGVAAITPMLLEGDPSHELQQQCLSADLITIGARTFFHSETDDDPGDTLRDLLRSHVCPVFVVPEAYQTPTRIILAYDASPGAARALRMFTYQTAGWSAARALTVLTVDDTKARGQAVASVARTYLEAHGRQVETVVAEQDEPPHAVLAFAQRHAPALVVIGASPKGAVSQLLLGSVTRALIADGTVAFFVTG